MGIIEFNGISSKDLGVEVETFPDYVAPEKEYQVTHVPGRNGDLVVDTKTFQNVPRSYEVSVATNGVPIEVVNAAVARFKSSSRMPIKSLSSEIKAVQDLHGYDHPWPGGGGKNKINHSSDVVISTGAGSHLTLIGSVNLVANVTYTFSCTQKNSMQSNERNTLEIMFDGNSYYEATTSNFHLESGLHSIQFTPTIDGTANFYIWPHTISTETTYGNFQLEVGSTATPYEPYENICPIIGFDSGVVPVCGKNLFSSALEQGTIETSTGDIKPSTIRCVNTDLIPIPRGSNLLSSNKLLYEIAYFDEAKNHVKSGFFNTFVAALNTDYAYFRISVRNADNSTILPSDIEIQFELGNTATAYEPYNGDTYTIPFGQTVYGGHFDNKGNLVVTHGIVDLGTLNWIKVTNATYGDFFRAFSESVDAKTNSALICTSYSASTLWYIRNSNIDKTVGAEGRYVELRDTAYTDAATFKTAMNGVMIVYELANPIVLSITSQNIFTLPGENTVFSNSGNVSVKVEPSFPLIINQVAEWLHSASGYARLEDTYDPDHYRMAYYSESLSVENLFNEAGKATLNFICKPQRYLKSGETTVVFTEEGTIQNGTRFSSSPILKVTTNNTEGSVAIGNHSITIKAGAGTDPITIDCELQDAWSGTSNKNSYIVLTDGEFPVIDPGTQTVTFDGGVQSVEVIPRWWTV